MKRGDNGEGRGVPQKDLYIAFTGTPERFAALSRFFERLAWEKAAVANQVIGVDDVCVDWHALLDAEAAARLGDEGIWGVEDIIDCVLNADYRLVGLEFDGRSGRLLYDPYGYPFGTDPLKGLVELFGLRVTADSFYDGYAEWLRKNG